MSQKQIDLIDIALDNKSEDNNNYLDNSFLDKNDENEDNNNYLYNSFLDKNDENEDNNNYLYNSFLDKNDENEDNNNYLENSFLDKNVVLEEKEDFQNNILDKVNSEEYPKISYETIVINKNEKITRDTDNSHIKNDKCKIKKDVKIKNKKKSEKIFYIKKENKNRGRLSNNLKRKNLHAPHNKFSDDNILTKIKARFIKNLLIYLNYLYSEYIGIKNSILILLIDPSLSRNINRKDNIEWFDKTVKYFFSYKISRKYKKYEQNSNIIRIDEFYKKERENPIKLIKILEMKIRDIYNIYIKDEKQEGFEEFDNLAIDKKQLEDEMNRQKEDKIKDYLEKYNLFAKNLEEMFIKKAERNYMHKKKK